VNSENSVLSAEIVLLKVTDFDIITAYPPVHRLLKIKQGDTATKSLRRG
jgi:hypothetical protein